jgi:hypothetical protein
MRENAIRWMELGVTVTACYMAAVTMVQTTLYARLVESVEGSFIGELLGEYIAYMDVAVIVLAVAGVALMWKRGAEANFGRIFMVNMLLFFPAVLDFSTFNWVSLIFDLTPAPKVTAHWVFAVGLILQVAYLTLRHTVRFREMRGELLSRGAAAEDIDQVSAGQIGYLVMVASATAALTAAIYLAAPVISEAAAKPLGGIPVPHVVIGVVVVLMIASALILYLRGRD